jgi:hypothetical protein
MLQEHERVLDFCLAGSAIYHPEPKDLDFLVLCVGENFPEHARWAFGSEFSLCSEDYDGQGIQWGALRNGPVNLIVTVDPEWYKRAKLANEVCAALKLLDKGDRIVTYRVIRDGHSAEQANARRYWSR